MIIKTIALWTGSLIAALALIGTTTAHADETASIAEVSADCPAAVPAGLPGSPLMKGLSAGPEELAGLMQASLLKDPHGNVRLSEKACAENGSCATPRMYLQAIVCWHPKSGFHNTDADMARMPSYIRGLSREVIKDTDFFSSRMVQVAGVWKLDLGSGFKRHLMPGEVAWTDTQTGEPILLENCANVAQQYVEVAELAVTAPPCIEVDVPVAPSEQDMHVAILGPTISEESYQHCLGIKRPGEAEFEKGWPTSATDCDYSQVADFYHRRLERSVCFKSSGPGIYVYRLPAEVGHDPFETVFCLDKLEGGKVLHSKDYGVRQVHYQNRREYALPAFIY